MTVFAVLVTSAGNIHVTNPAVCVFVVCVFVTCILAAAVAAGFVTCILAADVTVLVTCIFCIGYISSSQYTNTSYIGVFSCTNTSI